NQQYKTYVTIFGSETGQWNSSTLLFSQIGWHRRAIGCNGILYWLYGTEFEKVEECPKLKKTTL
ncbi:hypothetical protein PanWU01x14_326980, partial [Parasponia andersonii]